MLCLLILLCFVETKYLQCCYISMTWLYILISNGYILCSEHGNIETKYLQHNAATFLRHGYIYISRSSNSWPCHELKWHATESSYGHLLGLWMHFMGSSIDVSPLSTYFCFTIFVAVPYNSYIKYTCSPKDYIMEPIYSYSKSFLLLAYARDGACLALVSL